MPTSSNKLQAGFTLIELLVVIAIIGLLSSVVLASLQGARESSRDARRLQDMKQLQTALEMYYNDNGEYPEENSSGGGWEDSTEDGGDFIDKLIDEGYVSAAVLDPTNEHPQHYSYYQYSNGYKGCDKGDYYVLGVRVMETANESYTAKDNPNQTRTIHSQSPGWECPPNSGGQRDWQAEFDWVTGSFE